MKLCNVQINLTLQGPGLVAAMWGVLVFKEIKVMLLGLLPNISCLSLALETAVSQIYPPCKYCVMKLKVISCNFKLSK